MVVITIMTAAFAFLDALLASVSCLKGMSCHLTVPCLSSGVVWLPGWSSGAEHPSFPCSVRGVSLIPQGWMPVAFWKILAASFCNFTLHGLNRDFFVDTLAIWERLRMVLLTVMFTLLFVSFSPLVLQHFRPGRFYAHCKKASFSFPLPPPRPLSSSNTTCSLFICVARSLRGGSEWMIMSIFQNLLS